MGRTTVFLVLFIMVAFGDPTLGPENHCAWNCARLLKKREENIADPITPTSS